MSQKSETEATQTMNSLIDAIDLMMDNHHPLLSVIKNPKMLLEGLRELQKMVEMQNIKSMICNQIKFLITNKLRQATDAFDPFDNHMLHACISGFPGAGKTSVAKILAKIWISLDMIKSPTKKPEKTYIEELETTLTAYNEKLKNTNLNMELQLQTCKKLKVDIAKIKYQKIPNTLKLDAIRRTVRELVFNLEESIEQLQEDPVVSQENNKIISIK